MNLPCQPLDDVTLTRPSGTLSRRERGWWTTVCCMALSVRRRTLSSIVLHLQPRYRKCVHFGGGAYIEVENVRTTSLRTKGAYISGCDVRTCNLGAIANRLQLESPERHGGRSLQKAIYVPQSASCLSPGRVAHGSVDPSIDTVDRLTPPPAYAAAPLSTGAKTSCSAVSARPAAQALVDYNFSFRSSIRGSQGRSI
jgi:hypothetical protein